jgi:hypothetical protein
MAIGRVFGGLLVLMRKMAAIETTAYGAQDAVMPGIMACNAPDDCAFDASARHSRLTRRQKTQRDEHNRRGSFHGIFLRGRRERP